MKRALFLDRDGVICKDKNIFYSGKPILTPEDFEWEVNAREGIRELTRLEYLLVVVTNQPIIGKGQLSVETFHRINQPIYDELRKLGKNLDGLYFCPHTSQEGCPCRKPKLGMLLQAQRELGIDLARSWVIGDKTWEVKMGKDAGCKTILVRTGYGGRDNDYDETPDYIVDDLFEAAGVIQ